jgi:type II secretory pathway pseudopilin PulG
MKPYQIQLHVKRNLRNAFTLVELMVAMALIILMLSIMSQAFVIATGTMQGLKEVADMQEKIRPAITLLQRDLGANHFEGSKKLSDPEFWDNGPPKEGYFMLWQDQAFEPLIAPEPAGYESSFNSVSFSRSAAFANHMLAFTVKLPGKSPDDFFESSLGASFGNIFFNGAGTPIGMIDSNIRRFESNPNLIHSDWAEVAYFLGPHTNPLVTMNNSIVTPDGYTDGKTGPALPYFNLYRQQRMVLPSHNIAGVTLPGILQNSQISYEMGTPSYNKPSDLTVPWKRSMGNRTNISNTPLVGGVLTANHYLGKPNSIPTPAMKLLPLFTEYIGNNTINSDIIATNVISFDVKLLTDDQYDYESLNTILNRTPYSLNPAVGNYLPSLVFDTWTTDQGSSTLPVPKYDLGEWNTTPNKWQPSIPASNATIPVWGWYQASANPADKKPYKGIQIKAVQISLRVWDQKSNTAKMFVVVQKL